jgi:antitoxin MazE
LPHSIRRLNDAYSRIFVDLSVDTIAVLSPRDRAPAMTGDDSRADASQSLAASGDDRLVMGEFPNADDAGFEW